MRAKVWLAVVVSTAVVAGCGVVKSVENGVPNPITPEQSRARVVDAAQEIVGTLDLSVLRATFSHSSCNDQGEAPFRGTVKLFYPPASSFEESDVEVAAMVNILQSSGWTADSEFHSHGAVLKKNGVVVVFAPQNVSSPNRNVELLGECLDVTTKKGDTQAEPLTFG